MNQQTAMQGTVKMPFQPNYSMTAVDPSKAQMAVTPFQNGGSMPPQPQPAADFLAQHGMVNAPAPAQAPARVSAPAQARAYAPAPVRGGAPVQQPTNVAPAPQVMREGPLPYTGAPMQALGMMPNNVFNTTYSNGFVELPKGLEECKDFAAYIAKSELVPPPVRNRSESVFLLLARAATLGISWANVFSTFFVIGDRNGNLTMGMYVKAKAALCARFGKWDVKVDFATGDATVQGVRYDNGHQLSITYTGYEAGLMGKLGRDANGAVIGLGNWGTRWVDMMKARALGRFLDAMFPDIIGGFISKEDYDDRVYAASLEAEPETEDKGTTEAAQDAAAKITKLRKGRKTKAKDEEPAAAPVVKEASSPQSLDSLVIEEITENPLA